jgi:hypothetical protein
VTKIKIDANLYERIRKISKEAGYPTPEEFIVHVLEKELSMIETAGSNQEVEERLRGLGYLE